MPLLAFSRRTAFTPDRKSSGLGTRVNPTPDHGQLSSLKREKNTVRCVLPSARGLAVLPNLTSRLREMKAHPGPPHWQELIRICGQGLAMRVSRNRICGHGVMNALPSLSILRIIQISGLVRRTHSKLYCCRGWLGAWDAFGTVIHRRKPRSCRGQSLKEVGRSSQPS